jgi:hypothetical protein
VDIERKLYRGAFDIALLQYGSNEFYTWCRHGYDIYGISVINIAS